MSLKPRTVLVVDDDEGARDTVTALLKREFRVLRASTGEAALAVLGRDDVNAMIQLEKDKDALGCSDDAACLAELGGDGPAMLVGSAMAPVCSRCRCTFAIMLAAIGAVTMVPTDPAAETMPDLLQRVVDEAARLVDADEVPLGARGAEPRVVGRRHHEGHGLPRQRRQVFERAILGRGLKRLAPLPLR